MKPFDKIIFIRELEGISYKEKVLLQILSTYLGKNDFCFLSLSTLQKKTCFKKRSTVTRILSTLEKLEFIFILPPCKTFKSKRYSINFTKIKQFVDNFKKENKNKTEKERESYNKYKREYRKNKPEVESKCPGTARDLSRYPQGPVQVPPGQCPGTGGTPKYNINKFKRNLKEEPFSFSNILKAKSQSLALQNDGSISSARQALSLLGKKLSRQLIHPSQNLKKIEL